jgi:EmrB/QacA subfamily drug resistance transporter
MIEASFRPADRARAIGAWSGLAGVSTALGPVLGGWLIESISWRAIFLINLPIGIFVVILAARHVPETRDPDATGRLDSLGAVLAATGLAAVTYALIQAPVQGASAAIHGTAFAGVVALAAFLVHEHRSPNPMMPLSMFESRQFSAANLVTFIVYAALGGVFFLLVSFLQVTLGYSPIAAGAATLPITAIMLLFSARSGALARRIGPRIPLTVGPLVIAVGLAMMTGIDAGDSYVTGILPSVLVFGVGLTLVVAPVTATVLAAADSRRSGIASGINNAVARVGGLLAVAVLPLVAGLTGDQFYDPVAMEDGFHIAAMVCAGLSALGGVIAWLTIRSDLLGDDEDEPEPERYSCDIAGPSLSPEHHDPEPVATSP